MFQQTIVRVSLTIASNMRTSSSYSARSVLVCTGAEVEVKLAARWLVDSLEAFHGTAAAASRCTCVEAGLLDVLAAEVDVSV